MILSEQLREETFDDSYILETNSRKNAHLQIIQIIQIIQRLLSHVNKKDWQQSFIGRRNTSLAKLTQKLARASRLETWARASLCNHFL
jgi:hypothetical protein